MSIKFEELKKFDYYCKDVQELLFLYVVWPEEITFDERDETTKHLHKCPKCRNDYFKLKPIAPAIRDNPQCLVEHGILKPNQEHSSGQKPTHKEIMQIRFEARLERAILRRRRRERREQIAKIKRLVKPVAAVAACLIAAIGVYLTVSQLAGSQNVANPRLAVQSAEGSVKIELLTGSGFEIVPASQPIIALSGLKTLRINDNRQMVLNAGTELSIVPHDLGCIVKFDKGEIYTKVEHDGKPFIIETIHGRAVIIGTIFNIKTNDMQMELAVAEGSVSFESDNGSVNVTAGYKSLLALNNKPTKPLLCDTRQLTAWATDNGRTQEIATTVSYHSEIDLYPMFDSEQIDLEQIDYDSWIEQKRDWFEREFPHIFRFKAALSNEGIETDYPELLIKSGDLWRFAYPEKTSTQLIPLSYESMDCLASAYGKNKQWLSDNLHISQTYPAPKDDAVNLKSFDKWVDALEGTASSPSPMSGELLTYSLHASVYLSETRTLAWLAVSNDQIAVTRIEKTELLKLLEQEIKAASSCVKQFKQLFIFGDSSNACNEYEHLQLLRELIEGIKTVAEIERELPRYEAISK